MEYDVRRTGFRFVLGVAIVAALLYGVGWEQVLANLRTTDVVVLAPAFACTLLAMLVGSDGLRVVFGLPFRGATSSLARRAYLGSWFINSVLPAGNVGAGAFVAYTMRRADEDGVGGSVAGVASWEFLNMVASAVIAAAGVAGIAASGGNTGVAPLALGVFGTSLVAAGVLVVLLGTRRERVVDLLVRVASIGQRTLGRAVPALDVAHSREAISGGLDRFFEDVEALAADRRRLALAVGLAHLGWLLGALPLYFAMHAVGLPVSMAVVLVVIPLSGFAMAIPVPGGLGTVDAALGGLVVFFTAYPLGAVASAVVLYRLAKYPLQVLVGGLALWSLDRSG